MKKITLILILFVACCSWHVNAQVLNENFDSPTLPSGWSNEYVNKTEDWKSVTENMFGIDPHSGTHMAEFNPGNFGAITKLVTPSMDLTGVNNPQLNFFFANIKVGVVDQLRVYYKTSAASAWVQIGENYIHPHNDWTEVTLNLPEASNDYYIAFEGTFKYGGGLDLDDVIVAEGPSCLAPTSLTVKNLTTTSALLKWTEPGNATTWNIEYGPTGFTQGTGTLVADTDGTIGETITDLTANTVYDFYVNADCGGGDISSWAGPKQFSTSCEPIGSFPWTEDFTDINSPEVPACWSVVDYNDDGRTFETDNGFGVDGSPSVGYYSDFNNGNNDDYLILPPFELNGNQKLTFYNLLSNASQPEEFEVLLSTSEYDVEDFTTVILPATVVNTAGPNEVSIDLSAYSGIVHIAVHIPNSSTDGYYIYFDDFSMEDLSFTCPSPTDLTTTSLGDGSVDVSWTAGDAETEWELEYGAPGFALGSGTTVMVNDSPEKNLTGLDSNTNYEIYVTAICGASDESLPLGPIAFRTSNTDGCGQTQTSNNFEGVYVINPDSGYKIADDFMVSASTTNFSLETITANIVATGGVASADIAFFEDASGLPGAQIGATIQSIAPASQTLIGNYQGTDAWEVVLDLPTGVDFTNGANGEAVTYWVQFSAVAVVTGGPVGIEMTGVNTIGNAAVIKYQNDPWLIGPDGFDAVFSLSGNCTMVDCPEPTNLTVTNITENSGRITWAPGDTETEWEIEYGLAGFELGTGTVVTDNDGEIGETISGLDPATYYEYYITPLCGSGDPHPAGPAGFSTLCGGAIISFPFTESFEDTSGTRDCWTNEVVTGEQIDWKYVTANGNRSITPRTGELMAQFKTESFDDKTKFVSPALDLTSLTNPQLTFYYATTNYIADHDELRIFYKTSATGAWTQIGGNYTEETTVWTQVILDLPEASSEYYIAFEGKSNFGRGIDVDDVLVTEAPTCMQPSNLVANHMTENTVELSWDAQPNATNGYVWYVFEAGADPEIDTPVATGATTNGTTMVAVDGLTQLTVYDFYVKSDCGADGNSFLAGPKTFKTADFGLVCGDKFYDTGGASGDYGLGENVTTIISPNSSDEKVTVTFTSFDVEFGWDVLYVHNGPDASYPLIDSGNAATADFPAGGYYGQTNPGPFTSTDSSGALTFVFRSDLAFPYSGWSADVTCTPLGIADQAFESFSYYPNPVENTLNLKANNQIESVTIYNLLGQEVMSSSPNSTTSTLEMGNLQTGTYLMKVSINGNEETFRLLKK